MMSQRERGLLTWFLPAWSGLLLLLLASFSLNAWAVERVRVMALFQDKAMLEIDGKNRLLRTGETSPEGVRLISADAREAVIEVDGEQQSYQLNTQVGGSYKEPESREAQIWRDNTGSFTTVGSINGRTVNMLVDTGATSVAMSEREAKRLGIPYRLRGKRVMVGTASGQALGYEVTLDQVQVGQVLLRNVGAMVIEGDSPREVLLGMTFLSRVQMDNQGTVMILRSNY
jgi:aspartyl protease family protein